ncbi:MAG TPA: cbb3-type cytochrome c oxidase subunit I [Anaerolineae bacterium]|nr:cbb3-type cytochrome c oxidase subunit I [Anaerolineae bacterium]
MSRDTTQEKRELSPWWRMAVILILIAGFTVLIVLAILTYRNAPPIPDQVVKPSGEVVFAGAGIRAGQQVFLKYALMENGTIWGHGAYLGRDFSASYLHTLALDANATLARQLYGGSWQALPPAEQEAVSAEVRKLLKDNRYDPQTRILTFTQAEADSYQHQVGVWKEYFVQPALNGGLPKGYIKDAGELRTLTAFFAWTAWAAAADRPGLPYSYTNNFPYDPAAGNTAPSAALLWSALSLIALLGGTAVVMFAFGRFNYLGWRGKEGQHVHPQLIPGGATLPSQRGVIKYFAVVALLFFLQVAVGTAVAHYRADPATFYGLDLSSLLPSNLVRTWHLQLMIFWVATAYVAGGLFLAPALGGREPKGQSKGVNILFGGLLVVVAGSLIGEFLGINRLVGKLWFWIGHQGWEFLDLGRAWQILLAVGLVFWAVLLFRAIVPARKDPERREISSLFLYAAIAIPLLYLPAMFFTGSTNYSVVDMWRFWIIHLWVEGFFELFVTVMVAVIFHQLGLVSRKTVVRVVYLDAILYLASGIVGTGHHWYWTGQANISLALGAVFSALEIVPLTLLTRDAWDFIRLTRGKCDVCGQTVSVPHKWTFYFLIAVGVWNFVGAGIFGFLINLPIVSYYEVGTVLTPNHGHPAFMGVFGMLAVALLVFALREVLSDERWGRIEKFVKVSFWGLNAGLALMVIGSLFPGGILQLADVLQNGYWHARSVEFMGSGLMRTLEWLRMPGDLVFALLGVVPLVIAVVMGYLGLKRKSA